MNQLWPQHGMGGNLPSDLASVQLQPLSETSLDTIDSPYTPQGETIATYGLPRGFQCPSAADWLDPFPLSPEPLLPALSSDFLLGPDLLQESFPHEFELSSPPYYLISQGSGITTSSTNQEVCPSFAQTAWDRQGTFSSLDSVRENSTRYPPIQQHDTADKAASTFTVDCVTVGAQHSPLRHHRHHSNTHRPQTQALTGVRPDHAADATHENVHPKPRRKYGPTHHITTAAPAAKHSQEQALLIPEDSDYTLTLAPLQPVPFRLLGETTADHQALARQGEHSMDYKLLQHLMPEHLNFWEEGSSSACHPPQSSCPTPDERTNNRSPIFTNSMKKDLGQYRDTRAFITPGLLNAVDQESHMTQTGQHDGQNISSMSPFSSSSSSSISSISNEESISSPSFLSTIKCQQGVPSSIDGIYIGQSSNTLCPTTLKVVTSGPMKGVASCSYSGQDSTRQQQKKRARLSKRAYSSMTKEELEKRRKELNNQCCRENRGRRRQWQQIQEQECKLLQEHNAALMLQIEKLTRKKEVLSELSKHMDNMHFTKQ